MLRIAFSGIARHSVRSSAPAAQSLAARLFADAQSFLDRKEVTERVLNVLKTFDRVDPKKVSTASHFVNDLGLDSLDAVEIVMAFEEEFAIEIPDAESEKINSIPEAIDFICAHPMAK